MSTRERLLVANRGEIACRIFQAARELGLESVGVFAPGDETSRHTRLCDILVPVQSYLDVAEIVRAAKDSRATLVHPGYGFLSERPSLVRALSELPNIRFLGPTAESMECLGGKIIAKEVAEKAGVPTLPWAKVSSLEDTIKMASQLGFPLLIKAAAGGGGKGMRRVNSLSEVKFAAESAQSEAIHSFGDGTLFLERLLENPRHIEVQVLGDGRGNAISLYERECSLQRRHQKIWEEAPAPHLDSRLRQAMAEAAKRLTQELCYRSAGTVEFIVEESASGKQNFYFLEMNTRLQVEHPVTEFITGIDLVHEQIELGRLDLEYQLPEVPEARGHAIEVRLICEDGFQGFIPTPGKVVDLRWPTGPGIRVDSGIEVGEEVSPAFDSMIAKLIVHAPTRKLAIERMKFALSETKIFGLVTNQPYLAALARDPRVVEGRVHTKYLETEADFEHPLTESRTRVLETLMKNHMNNSTSSRPSMSEGQNAASASVRGEWIPSFWRSER